MFWKYVRRQQGLVTRDQARWAGWSDARIHRAVESGVFERVLPRVFRHPSWPANPEQFRLAVSLWLGEAGAISGLTAGSAWRLARIPESDRVTVTSWSRRSPHPLVVVQRARIGPDQVRRRDGLIVTTPARTLVDLAGSVSVPRLESATEDALHRRLCTSIDIVEVLASSRQGKRGRRRLADLLERRGDGPALQLELEVRTARLLRRSRLPQPARQHVVPVDGIDWSVDFAWPERRLGVECDGFESHGASQAQFEQDRLKLAALVSVGWRILPVTWTEVTQRPDRFLGRLADALDANIALP